MQEDCGTRRDPVGYAVMLSCRPGHIPSSSRDTSPVSHGGAGALLLLLFFWLWLVFIVSLRPKK